MTRRDLEREGPALRISELAKLTGFSRHKLYADVRRNLLEVHGVQCGQMTYWHVERLEALRYLDAMGFRWSEAS